MGRRESTNKVNYQELEGPSDDEFVWCEVCSEEYKETCPNCGPMKIVKDTPVEKGVPHRARKTLPTFLYINNSSKHGLGVFAKERMKVGIYFGPYEGERKEVGDPDLDSGYSFEIEKDGEVAFLIDAKDESKSNWMRFVNCASNFGEQNMRAFQYKSNIYYCTITAVEPNSELLVWYGDEYAKTLGLLTPSTTQKTKTGKRQTSRRKCKRKVSDASYKVDEKSKTKKRPKYSTRGAAKTNSTQKGSAKTKERKVKAVDCEKELPVTDESDVNAATNEDCIETADVSTDVHDLDTDSIYYRSNGIPHSVRFIQPGSDSPGLPDISEVPENTEVDCSLPEPHSSSSTSSLSGGTDFIFISDEDSGSNEQSRDRSDRMRFRTKNSNRSHSPLRSYRTRKESSSESPRPLKLRISNWNSTTATVASTKVTKSRPNISRREGPWGKIDREIRILQKDLEIKKLETEEAQLRLDGKLIEKELIELEARMIEVDDEILGKRREIQHLDQEMTSLQTMLKNMKKSDVSINTQNWSSRDKDEEIKRLKQELNIKTLEKTEPEMKIKKILLLQDKGYLDVEMNELGLKAETLKSKKTNIDEQIREVKSLLRTYSVE